MAKSGFWMRGAKGKLAGTAFYQSNGATIQREIVTPKNRKTNGQMTQRAKFANCIKFFKHSQQALFKFAFEDKRKQESDYNAFVRMNIKRSAVYDKELVDNPIYPAIGHNWILASGSLTPARAGFDGLIPYIALPSAPNLTHTLGELSQAFIKDYDLQIGDIVTMVTVVSDIRYSDQQPETYPKWTILQWQIDPNSEDSLVGGRVFKQAAVNNGKFRPSVNGSIMFAAGFACIFSRNIEGGKLKASYAELVNNEYAQDMVDYTSSTQQVINRALASWGATGDVILQGAQVINKALAPYVEPEVVEINGEENVPITGVSINAGDDAEYELGFNKTGVEIEDDDFSCDVPGVQVAVVGDDAIRVTAALSAAGSNFAVMYRKQLIISGAVKFNEGENITVNNTNFVWDANDPAPKVITDDSTKLVEIITAHPDAYLSYEGDTTGFKIGPFTTEGNYLNASYMGYEVQIAKGGTNVAIIRATTVPSMATVNTLIAGGTIYKLVTD